MFFSTLMSSSFLHRCRRFSTKRQNSQSVRAFHIKKLEHDIWRKEYLLNMCLNERALRDESFARSNFFYSRRRSRARFDENEWTFKACNCTTLYVFDQIFYTWNLLYISKSSDERSSFIVVDHVEFMKNLRSWSFARRQKKNPWSEVPWFGSQALRCQDCVGASPHRPSWSC